MQRDVVKFLEDIHRFAVDARDIAAGHTLNDYLGDKQLRYALERCFAVIGEALTQVKKRDPGTAKRISEWRKIIGFRNLIVHDYDEIRDDRTWDIVRLKLPILIDEVKVLFDEGTREHFPD
jgi:uncharacterized protein with HEPN domain